MAVSAAVQKFYDSVTTYQDALDAHITGVKGDIDEQAKLIAQLQATAGQLTTEDQDLLDKIQARNKDAVDKLTAVDDLTPPVVPEAPT